MGKGVGARDPKGARRTVFEDACENACKDAQSAEKSSTGRRRGTFNVGAIEGYANRLTNHVGSTSGLAGAASGLAGAASGLAGGSFAHRILDNDTSSEEDFRTRSDSAWIS